VADAPATDFLHTAAGVAIARRDLWILLQREMRHLRPVQRQPLEERFTGEIVRPFRALVRRERPELVAAEIGLVTTVVLATLASPSVYRTRMPPRAQQRILAAAAQAACHARWDPAGDRVAPAAPARPADRVTELLDTTIRLFAARGYQAVSLDDIGAELGLAGPSLYHYYATKSDILVAAFARAAEWLPARTLSLDDLVAAYTDLAVRERTLA
jgi:hypothetical protein